MTKLEYLLMYQKADLKKQQLENSLRTTESRQKLNKVTKLLREQQATLQKLTEEAEAQQNGLAKLLSQQDNLTHELELNRSEMETLEADEEVTAEELTEFRQDVERLNRELSRLEKDVKGLLEQLERISVDFQKARSLGGRAKKEYDRLKTVCEVEKTESAASIATAAKEMDTVERQVDPTFLAKYKKARVHHSMPVVPVVNEKCSGCNMSIPMAVIKKLTSQETVLECENCGRVLYYQK